MTRIFLFIFILVSTATYCHGQELPNFKGVKLNRKTQYKETEPLVLKVIDYLFQTPINKSNKSRRDAGQFLINWMNGTPEHVFLLEEKDTNYFNTDTDLMLMYMASLTKVTLDRPAEKNQQTKVLAAMQLALPYLNNQDDKKTWSKELWQLNDANQKHILQEFLYR